MKKFSGFILVLAMIGLVGCANDESLFDPIVGTWKNEGIGTTVLVLNRDNTVVETYSVADIVGSEKSGTWSSDSTSITITWSDDTIETRAYTFSSDHDEMTLTGDGSSLTYTRQ